MEVTVENTRKIVYFKMGGVEFPARVWQGKTESGIPVQASLRALRPKSQFMILRMARARS